MKIISPIYFLFLSSTIAFKPIFTSKNSFFPFHKNDMAENINLIDSETLSKNNHLDLINHKSEFSDNFHHFIEESNKMIGKKIVLEISSMLPHVDSIGHKVLHANNEFISYILAHDILNDTLKKEIVLLSIRLAQSGDDFGSHLLQLYYDIVNSCL